MAAAFHATMTDIDRREFMRTKQYNTQVTAWRKIENRRSTQGILQRHRHHSADAGGARNDPKSGEQSWRKLPRFGPGVANTMSMRANDGSYSHDGTPFKSRYQYSARYNQCNEYTANAWYVNCNLLLRR